MGIIREQFGCTVSEAKIIKRRGEEALGIGY